MLLLSTFYVLVLFVFDKYFFRESALQEEATKIYDEISALQGMQGDVVLDDRAERPGFKMNDALLLGDL